MVGPGPDDGLQTLHEVLGEVLEEKTVGVR
jgi:hypothetical protein